MPHFYHSKGKYYLTTNYKVMFSTLNHQADMYQPKARNLLWHRLCQGMFPERAKKHYLLVRNPYDRLESFYRNKLQRPDNITQQCIQNFYRFLDLDQSASESKVRKRLSEVSFSQFVRIIPNVYQIDGHLRPQYEVLNTDMHGLLFSLDIDEVIKIDNHQNDERLSGELKIDLGEIRNVTRHYDIDMSWSNESIEIVNRLYNMDFMLFDYEKRNP